jgi:hypothetical protein
VLLETAVVFRWMTIDPVVPRKVKAVYTEDDPR